MQDQDQCLQSCCTLYFALRLRGLDHMPQPHQTPRAFPSALPSYHPQHPLERLCHQCRGPRTGWSSQHWSHTVKIPAPGWACDPDGGTSPSQDLHVWRTVNWLSRQRGTKEKIQGLPQEFTQVLQHRPPSVDNYHCRAGRLAPHSPHSCKKLWNHTPLSPQRKTSAEKYQSCCCLREPKPWSEPQMLLLHSNLPVPDWPRQPWAGLQWTWTLFLLKRFVNVITRMHTSKNILKLL